ncbi:hypothetical protein J1N51_03475 [Psychrosphaera ytuae]|uniref:Uncharacterized protein n=1 Tax=Psychrosphaera ytuae TaxID=2820710 RepID=A0A975HIR7_9GAMM|nr:hypothetical protein [Psychrosphaera ytuae]QTH64546.1 hypothetical protein J1N51_03475 [Psychrosphaera ytuae]
MKNIRFFINTTAFLKYTLFLFCATFSMLASSQSQIISADSRKLREWTITNENYEALNQSKRLKVSERARRLYENPHFYNLFRVNFNGGPHAGKKVLKGYQNSVKGINERDIAVLLLNKVPIYGEGLALAQRYHSNPDNFSVSFGEDEYDSYAYFGSHTRFGKTNGAYQEYLLRPEGAASLARIAYFSIELGILSSKKHSTNFDTLSRKFANTFKIDESEVKNLVANYDEAVKTLPNGDQIRSTDIEILPPQDKTKKHKRKTTENSDNLEDAFNELSDDDKAKVIDPKIPTWQKKRLLNIDDSNSGNTLQKRAIRLLQLEKKVDDYHKDLNGFVSIVALVDQEFAFKFNRAGKAYGKIMSAFGQYDIEGELNVRMLGDMASGIGIVLTLMSKNSGPTADEVIMEMLGEVLANQKLILEQLAEIEHKQAILESDLSYIISISAQQHKETLRELTNIIERLDKISAARYQEMNYTRELFEEGILNDLKTRTNVLTKRVLDPSSAIFEDIISCKQNKGMCSKQAVTHQKEVFDQLSRIVSYATDPDIYRGKIFSSPTPINDTKIMDWDYIFNEVSAAARIDQLEEISKWMNSEYLKDDTLRQKYRNPSISYVRTVDTDVYENLINPNLFINVLLPEYLKMAVFYDRFDELFIDSARLKAQFSKIEDSARESREAIPLARVLLEKYGNKVYDHMMNYLELEPLAIEGHKNLLEFIQKRITNSLYRKLEQKEKVVKHLDPTANQDTFIAQNFPLLISLAAEDLNQLIDLELMKNLSNEKNKDIVQLGEHFGLWRKVEEGRPLSDIYYSSRTVFKGKIEDSSISWGGRLSQTRHVTYLELSARAKSLIPKSIRYIPEKTIEIKARYSIKALKPNDFFIFLNKDRENFIFTYKDDSDIRFRTKIDDPNYMGDKPEERPLQSERNSAILALILSREIVKRIDDWINEFGKKIQGNEKTHQDFANWEKARNALLWHIDNGYGNCINQYSGGVNKVLNTRLIELVYQSAKTIKYEHLMRKMSHKEFIDAKRSVIKTFRIYFPLIPQRPYTDKEKKQLSRMGVTLVSDIKPAQTNPIEYTKNKWGDYYGQFLDADELPRPVDPNIYGVTCDLGAGNLSHAKKLVKLLPKT